MKINYTLIAFIILLVWSIGATYGGYQLYKSFTRVSGNQEILLQQVDGLKKDKQLVLTPKEFRHALDSSSTALMKEVGIKVRNVENLVKASSSAGGTISFVPRDTIISKNDTIIPATVFNHSEKFLEMKGIFTKYDGTVTWNTKDSIDMLLYWKREGKFLPFLFGKKVYSGALKGINPYIKYTINKNIKVQRR